MPSYGVNIQSNGAQPIWYGNPDNPKPVTITNVSAAGTNIWIGETQSVGPLNANSSTQLAPGGYLSYDGTKPVYYAVADGPNGIVTLMPGVTSFFQPTNVINGGEFIGTNWISDSNGTRFYSGTPAFDNLIASIGNTLYNDPENNLVLPEMSSYGPRAGGGFSFVQMNNGSVNFGVSSAADENAWTNVIDNLGPAANGNGMLQYLNDTDNLTYKSGHYISLSGGSQQIVSVNPVPVSGLSVPTVLAGPVYHFNLMSIISPDQAAGSAQYGFDGTAVAGNANAYAAWLQHQAVTNVYTYDGNLAGLAGSHAFAVGIEQVFTAEIWAVFSAGGTFNVRAQEGTSGDTFHIKSSILRMEWA